MTVVRSEGTVAWGGNQVAAVERDSMWVLAFFGQCG